MNDYLRGQIESHCYMVERGKPAACLPVQSRYIDEAKEIIEEEQLKSYTLELVEDWKEVWIYKHDHILNIINRIDIIEDRIMRHWMLGKLFGYDENSIGEYIKSRKGDK